MKRTIILITSGLIGFCGAILIGLADLQKDIYLIDSVFWTIDNQFIMSIIGISMIILGLKCILITIKNKNKDTHNYSQTKEETK